MGKNFKNHLEYLQFNKIQKRNSNFAERLLIQVEKELLYEYLNEQNVLERVNKLL